MFEDVFGPALLTVVAGHTPDSSAGGADGDGRRAWGAVGGVGGGGAGGGGDGSVG